MTKTVRYDGIGILRAMLVAATLTAKDVQKPVMAIITTAGRKMEKYQQS